MVEQKIPNSMSDIELARMAREDTKAEEALLRRLYPKIFQIAWSVVGSRWLADDVAQVAAVQVLKSLHGYSGVGSLESWAGRIAYRVSMRMVVSERQRKKKMFPLLEEKVSVEEGTEKSLSRRILYEKLVGKMDTIPRKRRIPLLLHLAYGYTVGEVAELTDASPNTVKDRLKTAYKELQTIVEEHPTLRAAMLEEIS